MENKSVNINDGAIWPGGQEMPADHAVFFKKFDAAISELEQSFNEINKINRPGAKVSNFEEFLGAYEANRSVLDVREDSSIGTTPKLPKERSFCNGSKSGLLSSKDAYSEGNIAMENIMKTNIYENTYKNTCKNLGQSFNGVVPVRQYDCDAEQKAFWQYMAKGELRLNEKLHLLSQNGDDNGYRIPCQTISQLEERMRYLCPMRSLAKIDKISGNTLDIFADKSNAEVGWIVSNAIDDGEEQELEHLQISVHQMYARPRTTQKVLDDAGDGLQEWIITKITQKMAALENHAFLYGNGENQPMGILQYPTVPIGEGSWGKIECIEQFGDKVEIRRESLLELAAALSAQYLPNAVWFMSRSALMAIQNIKDEMGRFLWQQSLSAGTPSCLLGYNVVICDDMPALAPNCTPVLFGDFAAAYRIVDRSDISVLRDPYSHKPFVEFFVTKRTGGDVIDFDAVKALKL
ncbi:MAG: phage major capsid protein [Holosporales bacterium]|jgi:HK97 family phage major capsid protein|nr:phage major capsid protein [Holosporales bacterium]